MYTDNSTSDQMISSISTGIALIGDPSIPNTSNSLNNNVTTAQGFPEKKGRFKVTNVPSSSHSNMENDSNISDSKPSAQPAGKENSVLLAGKTNSNLSMEDKPGVQTDLKVDESALGQNRAPPKKNRFTVKTVVKKDDETGVQSYDTTANLPSPAVASVNQFMSVEGLSYTNSSAGPLSIDNSVLQKLEYLLEMNTQVLSCILQSEKYQHLSNTATEQSPHFVRPVTLSISQDSDSGQPVPIPKPTIGTLVREPSRDKTYEQSSTVPTQTTTNNTLYTDSSVSTTEEKVASQNTSAVYNKEKLQNQATPSQFVADKDKGLTKLFHHVTELKKELEVVQKQRKESLLESQRLREKCQQQEDRVLAECARSAALEERLEKSKAMQRTLQSQLDQQAMKIESQNATIEHQTHLIQSLTYQIYGNALSPPDSSFPSPANQPLSSSNVVNTQLAPIQFPVSSAIPKQGIPTLSGLSSISSSPPSNASKSMSNGLTFDSLPPALQPVTMPSSASIPPSGIPRPSSNDNLKSMGTPINSQLHNSGFSSSASKPAMFNPSNSVSLFPSTNGSAYNTKPPLLPHANGPDSLSFSQHGQNYLQAPLSPQVHPFQVQSPTMFQHNSAHIPGFNMPEHVYNVGTNGQQNAEHMSSQSQMPVLAPMVQTSFSVSTVTPAQLKGTGIAQSAVDNPMIPAAFPS